MSKTCETKIKVELSALILIILLILLLVCGCDDIGNYEAENPTNSIDNNMDYMQESVDAQGDITQNVIFPQETNVASTNEITIIDDTSEGCVIVGVKSMVCVYEDDSRYTINTALLAGVTLSGGCEYDVKVKISELSSITSLKPGYYDLIYYCEDETINPVLTKLLVKPADKTPPVISGAVDKIVVIGDSVSYRKGVEVTDNDDENVKLIVDASHVNLTRIGTYTVSYSATDKRGNTSSLSIKVTVINRPDNYIGNNEVCTEEEFQKLCNDILKEIIFDGMTDYDKAAAIYDRVHSIKYVSTTVGDDNWVTAAYIGLTTGRGDCQNYAAASKALLSMAEIPNYDMEREGGKSKHFWNIVYVNDGWYHFDACPTLPQYPMKIFLLTDDEAIAYSKSCLGIPNYLIYDYEACPYEVVKSRD